MSEISEEMLNELEVATGSYATDSENMNSVGCGCGHTCQFNCDESCWSESAMGF